MHSVEMISALSCKLQVLYLILSYRNMSSAGNVSQEKSEAGKKHTRRARYRRPAAQDRRKAPV